MTENAKDDVRNRERSEWIVVGYNGSEHANDALALARLLAPAMGAAVVAVCVFPPRPGTPGKREGGLRDQREVAREKLALAPDPSLPHRLVQNASIARGLAALAEELDARVLVVGSSHRGRLGEALLGSTGRSVLHDAPCPVAVAPRGFAESARIPAVIGVGFDGSPESQEAVHEAVMLAAPLEAKIELVGVIEPGELLPKSALHGADYQPHAASAQAHMRDRLYEVMDGIPEELRGDANVTVGEPDVALKEQADRGIDLLVIGSRGYAPARQFLVGSVAATLLQRAPCPIIVLPHGTTSRGSEARKPLRAFAV